MATATAPGIKPVSDWDDSPVTDFTTKAGAAGSVAWAVLTHSQGNGPDIARMIGPEDARRELPAGMDAEDVFGFLWDLVGDAAEVGYAMAQIELSGLDHSYRPAKIRTCDVARSVAALLRVDIVEDDQTFDPTWHEAPPAESKKVPA